MSRLKAILGDLGEESAELAASLSAAYDEDVAEYSSAAESATAKISEISAERDAMSEALTAAKAANWDLLQQVSAEPADTGNDGGDTAGSESADEPAGVDAMFGEDE